MCEAYVRIIDKINEVDPVANLMCSKRGDVIVVCPDGWQWSPAELASPQHRILKLPGVTEEQMRAFTASDDPGKKKRHRRPHHLDLDHPNVKDGATFDELMAARVAKPVLHD